MEDETFSTNDFIANYIGTSDSGHVFLKEQRRKRMRRQHPGAGGLLEELIGLEEGVMWVVGGHFGLGNALLEWAIATSAVNIMNIYWRPSVRRTHFVSAALTLSSVYISAETMNR